MKRIRAHLFVFVTNRLVPPTNKISEQALRPSAIFRKVTNGFRSTFSSGRLNGPSVLQTIIAAA